MSIDAVTEFGRLCRAHRTARRLTQKRVAELAGLATATIGTLEHSPYRVLGPENAVVLADKVFHLDRAQRAEFLAAHEATPLSPFSERRRDFWKKRNALRSKSKNYDRMHYALSELAMRFIQDTPPGDACRCEFGGGSYGDPDKPCEVCFALETAGILGGLGDQERTLGRLHKIMTELEPRVFPERKRSKG